MTVHFIPQLFFWTILCFHEIRQGREWLMAAATLTSGIDAFKRAALSCPLPAVLELIGEKWAFLILRGALNGLKHFEEFQAGLGIARNILSDRLSKLVAGGILERRPDPGDGRRVIYSLTPKGEDLLPVVLALRQWGDKWGYGKMNVVLADRRDGKPVRNICVLSHDGRELTLGDLTWVERKGPESLRTAAE
jgi:DNA-binding HxlR family transcriptional regulator